MDRSEGERSGEATYTSPSCREAARCEQAKRDNEKATSRTHGCGSFFVWEKSWRTRPGNERVRQMRVL